MARDDTVDADDARPRVLMVDDYAANLQALEAILEPLDLRLIRAGSGEEALLQVLRSDFALILMDVQMPDLDGFGTAALIKKRDRSRHIPIIFLTAISRDAEHIFEGYAQGAVDYLVKPFHPAILRSKVRVFVDLYRQSRIIQRQERELRERERAALELQNERRFRELTDALPNLVCGVAPDGSVYYANRAWRELGGEAPDDVFRLPGLHPDDEAPVREQWERALADGEAFESQFRLRLRGGSPRGGGYRWQLGRAVPERDERGQITGWLATGTDVDDRIRAERVLSFAARASGRLAESLCVPTTAGAVADLLVPELAAVAVVRVVGEQGQPIEVSRGPVDAEQLRVALDRTPETAEPDPDALEALGISAWHAVPLTADGRSLGALWVARTSDQPPFTPDEIQTVDDLGRRASVALDHAALFDLAQRERRRAETASRAKDDFLAKVSHELRSPLSAILGWATMLAKGSVPPDMQGRALDTILRSVRAQARLVEDLLDSAKISNGQLRLAVRPITLAEVVEAAVDVVRPSAQAKQIDLTTDLDPDLQAIGDPERLQQVVWNLVANSVKFTPSGGRITVRVGRGPDAATISVEDQGEGIAPEFLPFVFDPFRQADRTRSGLGLGLAISKELVQLHGGTIGVSSEGRGKGTTFVVRLPFGPRPSDEAIGN